MFESRRDGLNCNYRLWLTHATNKHMLNALNAMVQLDPVVILDLIVPSNKIIQHGPNFDVQKIHIGHTEPIASN